MKRHDFIGAGAAVSTLWGSSALVQAQSSAWPTRGPIRLLRQFPPSGLVGTDYASKQGPDGYTLLVSHASVHIYATATRKTMPFDPVDDFTHMGMLVETPMVLLVRAQSPFQTQAQYVAAATTKPVHYGTPGIGSANHLFGELLKIEGQAPELDHVPYQGSAPAI